MAIPEGHWMCCNSHLNRNMVSVCKCGVSVNDELTRSCDAVKPSTGRMTEMENITSKAVGQLLEQYSEMDSFQAIRETKESILQSFPMVAEKYQRLESALKALIEDYEHMQVKTGFDNGQWKIDSAKEALVFDPLYQSDEARDEAWNDCDDPKVSQS